MIFENIFEIFKWIFFDLFFKYFIKIIEYLYSVKFIKYKCLKKNIKNNDFENFVNQVINQYNNNKSEEEPIIIDLSKFNLNKYKRISFHDISICEEFITDSKIFKFILQIKNNIEIFFNSSKKLQKKSNKIFYKLKNFTS
jgi:hypothetical protein